MKRGSATSGGQEHIELVKLATKRIVDRFVNLHFIIISYEAREFSFELKIADKRGYHRAFASLEFRPDIFVEHESEELKTFENVPWTNILDSGAIVIEAETDPHNFFNNLLKCESYKRIRAKSRKTYAFVLVVWDDAKLPKNIEPFDEVWRFPRKKETTK